MEIKKPNVLGVIPARGGSKSVPHKNLAPLNGKPMMVWTIEAAQNSKLLTHFVVSSEDEKIIRILQRTWAKMSDAGHEAALQLPLSDEAKRLVGAALA